MVISLIISCAINLYYSDLWKHMFVLRSSWQDFGYLCVDWTFMQVASDQCITCISHCVDILRIFIGSVMLIDTIAHSSHGREDCFININTSNCEYEEPNVTLWQDGFMNGRNDVWIYWFCDTHPQLCFIRIYVITMHALYDFDVLLFLKMVACVLQG